MVYQKTFVACVIWLLSSVLMAQEDYDVQWSKLQRKQGSLLYLLPKSSNEFYALRWTGGRLFGHYKVSHHKNFELESSTKIRLQAKAGIANFEGARVVDGRFMVFLSDKLEGENRFYMQPFTSDLERDGEAIHLASYKLDRKRGKGRFEVKLSANGKFLGVVWQVSGKKDMKHLYGFKVFDMDMELVNDGEYTLPFDPKLSAIHEHHVSNTGDYFLCLTEYEKDEKRRWLKNGTNYKTLHIYHISDDEGLQDFELELDGKQVVAMAMSSDENGVFTITGIYGEKDVMGVSGVFYRKVKLESGELLSEGFRKFDDEFITEYWPDRVKRKVQKQQDRGKGDAYLYNYRMRDVTFLKDGSILGTMEQYYVQMRSNPDARASGQTSNVYYYYYNDIIVYKVGPTGEFDWVKKVRKYQVSINDGGPYSSYESFVDDGKAYFIFNDNSKNYDSTGVFIDEEKIHTANYSRRRNVVAIAEIDLDDGELKRRTFLRRDETNTLAVPKLFDVNYRTGEMLLYSILGRREKLGVLKFKN